ncbi:Pectate lyase [Paenibacillus tarimensis]
MEKTWMNKKKKTFRTAASVLCLTLAVPFVMAGSAAAGTPFSDDFNDGNAAGWNATTGSWSVVQDSGSYVYYQSSTSEGRTQAGDQSWTDYSVQARVKVEDFNGTNRAYVAGRYKDGNNYYAASLYNSSGGKLEIRRKAGGSSSTLVSKAYPLSAGVWYTVKLEMTGSTIKLYVNDVLELTATDSTLSSGGVGLVSYKTKTKFDDVVVTDSGSTPTDPGPGPDPGTDPGTDPDPDPDPTPADGDLFVAPNGSAGSAGTISSPTTLESALSRIAPGKTIYMRGGTYRFSSTITIERGNNGSASARKAIVAYGSEKPVLDFSAQAFGSANRGLQMFGHYWTVKGIEVTGAGDNGIFIGGNYNRIENVEAHHNRDTGIQMGRYASTAAKSEWPQYNEVINSYSHNNFDPDNGEDADGFAAKLTVGPGNVFDGCIAAYNVDDGWDLYTKSETGAIGAVTIRNSIAHHNGQTSDGTSTSDSDGNGFKLGGEKIAVDHIVENSIAFQNKKHGFTYNSNPGTIRMKNNTSWDNGQSNFAFDIGTHQFINNLSLGGGSSDKTSGTDVDGSNVWWKNNKSVNAKGLLASSEDFVSLTPTVGRSSDGSPSLGSFLSLTSGSDLKGAGTPAGTNIGAR